MKPSPALSPSEQRREIASWLESEDASNAPLEDVQAAAAIIEGDAIGFAEDNASGKQRHFQTVFESRKDNGRRVDIFAAMGANRSGKTFVGGIMCFAKHLRDRAKPSSWYWCVAPNLDRSIGGQQRELWEALPRWMFGDQRWDEKIGFGAHRKIVLNLGNGGTCLVEFRSVDQDDSTYEQAKLDGAWIDESCSEAKYNRLLARIIDKRGFIIITDIYEQFWYMERLNEAPPDAGTFFMVFTMFDNEANLPQGEIATASARMSEDERRLRIHGELIVLEGIVFKQYIDTIHAIDPFPIPVDWPKYRMIDYGGSSPTACPWIAVAPNEHLYVYREHYERGPSVATHAKNILLASGDEKYVQNYIDPAAYNTQPGMTETIARQYELAGIRPLIGWPRVNEMGEHAMVQKVKQRFENRTLWVFKPCTNMRRELRSWKHQLDKDGKPKGSDAYENANNHLIDGLKGFVATNPTYATQAIRLIGAGSTVNATTVNGRKRYYNDDDGE